MGTITTHLDRILGAFGAQIAGLYTTRQQVIDIFNEIAASGGGTGGSGGGGTTTPPASGTTTALDFTSGTFTQQASFAPEAGNTSASGATKVRLADNSGNAEHYGGKVFTRPGASGLYEFAGYLEPESITKGRVTVDWGNFANVTGVDFDLTAGTISAITPAGSAGAATAFSLATGRGGQEKKVVFRCPIGASEYGVRFYARNAAGALSYVGDGAPMRIVDFTVTGPIA